MASLKAASQTEKLPGAERSLSRTPLLNPMVLLHVYTSFEYPSTTKGISYLHSITITHIILRTHTYDLYNIYIYAHIVNPVRICVTLYMMTDMFQIMNSEMLTLDNPLYSAQMSSTRCGAKKRYCAYIYIYIYVNIIFVDLESIFTKNIRLYMIY